MHHRLGYDLPERTGFGGLWSAMDGPRDSAPVVARTPRHVVATSGGASSAQVRTTLAAFLRTVAAPVDGVAA